MARRSTEIQAEYCAREKVTVVLLQRHVAYLDVLGVLIRMRHQRAVARADIIQALVEFVDRSGLDFSQFESSDAMVEHLIDYFGRIPHQARLSILLERCLFPSMRPPIEEDAAREKVIANA